MLALQLPPEIEARLDALAKATGRTKSDCARKAIIDQLEDMEDIYLAEREIEDIRAGRSDTVPLSDVMCEYGLED